LPIPSKLPGRVRGFQMPARIALTLPPAAIAFAVSRTWYSLSALHGPAIKNGSGPLKPQLANFDVCFLAAFTGLMS
jgi:hypothetical protein